MTVPQLLGASSESLSEAATPLTHRTVIILDWDDTLLASSWLAMNDLRLDNTHFMEDFHREELKELEVQVERFLGRAITLGKVLVVTNAETGWVELSCERFLPGLSDSLSKVKIVSARSKYESRFPNQPHQWKIQAFREEISIALEGSNEPSNVISIGDSHHEREALHVVTSELENTLVKSVKFVERPAMDVLRKQVELVHGCIEYITQHSGDLDLMLSQSLLFGAEQPPADENMILSDEEAKQQEEHIKQHESDLAAGAVKVDEVVPTWEEMEAITAAVGNGI